MSVTTIGDVAKAAGVSRSTVSYALSGKRTISAETRRRIDETIKALNFTPNAGARALKTAQTMVLGLLLQFHEDEFAPAMLQYLLPITESARALGYDILLMTEGDGSAALTRVAQSGMVDGLILLDVAYDDPRVPALRAARQPGVLIGLPSDSDGLDVFDLDFRQAAHTLVDHLHALGHDRICLITPPRHVYDRGAEYAWRFRDAALERAAHHRVQIAAHHGESRQPAIDESLNRILDSAPDATALIVHNDASVAVLPAVLHSRGVRVPDDLSVVSIYSTEFGRSFSLPYTAVESSPDELGRLAVAKLADRIRAAGDMGPPGVRFLAAELVDRGSTR